MSIHVTSQSVINQALHHICEGVAGAKSLYFLRAVAETVDALSTLGADLSVISNSVQKQIDVFSVPNESEIDPDDTKADLLLKASNDIKDFYLKMNQKKQSALDDPELDGDHEESIVMVYDTVLDQFRVLYTLLRDLRWLIMDSEATHDDIVGPFTNAGDLIASLKQ